MYFFWLFKGLLKYTELFCKVISRYLVFYINLVIYSLSIASKLQISPIEGAQTLGVIIKFATFSVLPNWPRFRWLYVHTKILLLNFFVSSFSTSGYTLHFVEIW